MALELPPALAPLVSPRTGVIRRLQRVEKGVTEHRLPLLYQATLAHFDFQRRPEADRASAGKGETEEAAAVGAVAEALERYCSSQPRPDALVRASMATLGGRALDPRECVLYSERQYAAEGFPYERFDETRDMFWVSGRTLPDGGEILVPASFAYLSAGWPGQTLCHTTSNGLAAGPSPAFAALHGLYELIERDAFLITWMNRLPVPEIDISGMQGAVGAMYRHYRRYGVRLRVFDTTTDIGVPAMMAVATDESGDGPAAVVGLGCHLDPFIAVRRAAFEVSQVRAHRASRRAQRAAVSRALRPEEVRTIDDHSALFAVPEMLREMDFLLAPRVPKRPEDLVSHASGDAESDLGRVVDALSSCGSRVVCADLTTDDIAPLDLRVVRMIATGLQPMHFGYGQERLGGDRLLRAPQRMGYASRPAIEAELNRCPHPLA